MSRLRSYLERRLAGRKPQMSPRAQQIALVAASLAFVVGGLVAVDNLDLSLSALEWLPIALAAVVGVPANAALTAMEYQTSARIVGHKVPFRSAARVSLAATAANLLPIPGAALVRIQALKGMGTGYGRATSSTALVGIIWLGIAAVIAGVFLFLEPSIVPAVAFTGGGVAALVLGHGMLFRQRSGEADTGALAVRVSLIEAASILVGAARLFLVLAGLGLDARLSQGMVLAVSGALASSVGVFPGGLGLREAIAGALAPLVGLTVSAGFLAAGVNRILGILVHVPLTLLTLRWAPADSAGSANVTGSGPGQ